MELLKDTLDTKYVKTKGRVFLNGNQALSRLPMLQKERDQAAGLNTAGFISGYRGSPLGGLDKTLWQAKDFLKEHDIHFQPGLNEDLAATSIWGAQQVNIFQGAKFDGVFSMWYGKGPGVDRCGDVFRHANSAGTSRYGGVLVIAGDDHASKSSTLPHQTEYAFVDAMIPILNPAGVQEVIDLGLYGWALSRFSGCWVALKTLSETVDASYTTDIDINRIHIYQPERDFGNLNIRWPDDKLEQEVRLHQDRMDAVIAFGRANHLNRLVIDNPSPRLGIISTGKSYLDVLQALDDLGIDKALAEKIGLRLYKVGMPWPLEPEGIREFAQGLDEILVVEEKRGLIEEQLTSQLYNWNSNVRPLVIGKRDEAGKYLLPSTGELTPAVIGRVIAARVSKFFNSEPMKERLRFLAEKEKFLNRPKDVIPRLPHYCSGCPHNTSTRVPEGSRALGGIGCHYMATWMDRQTDTYTQMGGEGATWIGQAPFTEEKHVFQNLGDGTYFHSGLLAIRAAIASGVNITYKILYNDAVAMTGGQPVDGQLSVPMMSHQLRSEGIDKIVIVSDDIHKYTRGEFPSATTFYHRDDLEGVQNQLREYQGTSILIYDQTCAAEKRRRRKKGILEDPAIRAFINPLVCEGCGDCGIVSNCLSVIPKETEYGRKRSIDQGACNKDMSCIKGFCPSFVSVIGGELKKPDIKLDALDVSQLPQPDLPPVDRPYGIVIAGVGGTGVTTLGAILGMAAHLESKGGSLLDMTGLAQKFGPVITHLQIAKDPESIYASRIAAGGARLLLGCDLVVAAANDSTVKLNPETAHAIVNSHQSMTAEFTRDPDAKFPGEPMKAVIAESAGEHNTTFLEVDNLIRALQGDTTCANTFLAGYAYQKGLIPLSEEAINRAIELNGSAVEQNLQAFASGRYYAHDPETILDMISVKSASIKEDSFTPLSDLEEIISDRKAYLTAYQNEAYAERYESLVRRVIKQDKNGPVSLSVAKNYFKLLAYKDEYEVARLFSDKRFTENLDSQFQGNYKIKYHLAPPVIAPKNKFTGLPKKIAFGQWASGMFRTLQHFKFLRGTAFDPFGYIAERKLERQLIAEYEEILKRLFTRLSDPASYGRILELVSLPEKIRGYGHIKERNVEKVREETSRLLKLIDTPASETIKLVAEDEISETGEEEKNVKMASDDLNGNDGNDKSSDSKIEKKYHAN